MDITFRTLDAKLLTRAIEIAVAQHERAYNKAVEHFGSDSASAKEIDDYITRLKTGIADVKQMQLPLEQPKKK